MFPFDLINRFGHHWSTWPTIQLFWSFLLDVDFVISISTINDESDLFSNGTFCFYLLLSSINNFNVKVDQQQLINILNYKNLNHICICQYTYKTTIILNYLTYRIVKNLFSIFIHKMAVAIFDIDINYSKCISYDFLFLFKITSTMRIWSESIISFR